MFKRFKHWGIKTKIMSILIASISLLYIAVEMIIVPYMQQYIMTERKIGTQHVVEVAYSIIERYAQQVNTGEKSPREAKAEAVSLIKSLHFVGPEYFWIHDLSRPFPRMIMHSTIPSLDGKVLDNPEFNRATSKSTLAEAEMVKVQNRNIFIVMNEVADSAGEGFVAYSWPKPLAHNSVTVELYPKISFFKKYVPWGWVIGSGVYVDDIKTSVMHVRRLILTTFFFFCMAAITIYFLLIRYISRPVSSLAQLANRIASGDYSGQFSVSTNDEIGLLFESLKQMSSQIRIKTEGLETANRNLELELAERRRAEEAREEALVRISKLEGIIPICMHCKKIRDDQNSWNQLEQYIMAHSEAVFSHGICPQCYEEQMALVKSNKKDSKS